MMIIYKYIGVYSIREYAVFVDRYETYTISHYSYKRTEK